MITDYRLAGEAPQMGRNLFAKQDTYLSGWGTPSGYVNAFTNYVETGYTSEFDFTGNPNYWEVKYLKMDLQPGQDYTFSFVLNVPQTYSTGTAGQGMRIELRKNIDDLNNINSSSIVKSQHTSPTAGTYNVSFSFNAPDKNLYLCLNFGYAKDSIPYHFKFSNFKMEFGTSATAWTSAPEDSPNLVPDSHFYSGSFNGWGSMYGALTVSNSILKKTLTDNHTASRMEKIFSLEAGDYTLSVNARVLNGYRFSSLENVSNIRGNTDIEGSTGFQTNSITFNVPTTGNVIIRMYYNEPAIGDTFEIDWVKLEKGTVATAWTPSPQDVGRGLDRNPIAIAQKTITDWNDSLSITAFIKSNISLTQKYDPGNETYTPDYSSTNLVLTASLFKSNSTEDIINDGNVKSIKWYRKTPKDSEVEVTNNLYYSVNGKTCTRKDNLDNSYGSMEFRVEIVYNDPISKKDVTVQNNVTAHVVQDAGGVNKAVVTMNGSPNLQNGKPTFVQSDISEYGRNILYNSSLRENIDQWNTSSDTNAVMDINEGYPCVKFTGILNKTQYIHQPILDRLTPGTYTISGYAKVNSIVKGTTNYYVAFYTSATYEKDGVSTWWGPGSATIDPTKVGWQYYSFQVYIDPAKFATCSYLSFYMYARDFSGAVWFRDVKVEKGETATPWSMAPEDRPSITQATGADKWIFRRYQNPTNSSDRIAPTYEDLKSLLLNEEKLVDDNATLYNGTEYDYYYGYLGTSVYVPEARTLPISFHQDDTVNVYVNNQIVYTDKSTGENSVTLDLIAGWNTLEFLYYELTGAGGIWNVATEAKQVLRNAADLSKLHTYPGMVYGALQEDGWYRYPLNSKTSEILQDITRSVLQGSTYTQSILLRTDSTTLTFKFSFYESNNGGHNVVTTTFTDLGNGVKRAAATYTMNSTIIRAVDMIHFGWSDGTYVEFKHPKLELGSTATEFSIAPEDVAPSILKTHVEKVNAFYTTPFETYLTNLTATCHLWRSSIEDTTNVSYQWYKKDDSVKSDQGGGVGWLKLTGSSPESGYNLDTLVIPGHAVDEHEVYKCVITDTWGPSNTVNQKFTGYVTVSDAQDPLEIRVTSSIGNTFKNGQGQTTLTAHVFQKDIELDFAGTKYTYKWYKYNKDGVKDASWNGVGYKTGKKLVVTSEDIAEKSTFSVDVTD